MTAEVFQKEQGPAFRKFQRTELYSALLAVFEAASPARTEIDRIPGDVVAGGQIFFAQTQAHERLVRLFRDGLSNPPAPRVEREPDYAPSET